MQHFGFKPLANLVWMGVQSCLEACHTELHNSQETTQSTAIAFGHHFQSSERALLVTSCFALHCHCFLYFHAQHKSVFFLILAMTHTLTAIIIDIYIYAMHLQKSLYTCEIHSGGSIEPHESHTCQPQKPNFRDRKLWVKPHP